MEPYFARRDVIATDAVRCPTCTRIADADDRYCSKCGTALAIQSDPPERTKIDFERFFDLAVDVFVVTGPDGHFELVNQALARLLGVDREVILAHPWSEFVHPDDRERSAEENAREFALGHRTITFENRYVDAAGGIHWMDWSAELDPASGLVYGIARDVTERRAAHEALVEARAAAEEARAATAVTESEQRFRAVLESSPNAVIAVDDQALITYINPQASTTFGYARDELIGQPIELLLPERVAERHVAHRNGFLGHPLSRPMGIGLDLAGRRKGGTEFPVEISLSPVDGASGVQVFATVVDITARKAAESQLLEAQKLESIGRLAGGIAHDFNNMLFAIRGYSELLADDLSAGPESFDAAAALRSVAAINDAAERASSLTSQLLAFSRRQVVSPRVVDINAAIRAVEPMLRPLIGEHVRLHLMLDPDTGHIRVDPSQLDQILVNLAVNARDAMPGGGTITIESGSADFDEPYALDHPDVAAGRYASLAVSDTGVGMDRETREHAFEPFFTTKDQGKGTGLGLATIYGIVRQAGGHIWLYSEPGHGSVFKLYFPRVDSAVTGEEPSPVPATRGSGTAIVVEDDPAVRRMTSLLLERSGYRVLAVPDGQSALAAISEASKPFDVLVTDVIMPNMSGIELAARVSDRDPSMGIVLLSGYTAETLDLERATAHGAIFVAKPVTSRQLVDAVQRATARKRNGPARRS